MDRFGTDGCSIAARCLPDRTWELQAVIAHYSGVNHRPDMAERKVDTLRGTWAVFDMPLF